MRELLPKNSRKFFLRALGEGVCFYLGKEIATRRPSIVDAPETPNSTASEKTAIESLAKNIFHARKKSSIIPGKNLIPKEKAPFSRSCDLNWSTLPERRGGLMEKKTAWGRHHIDNQKDPEESVLSCGLLLGRNLELRLSRVNKKRGKGCPPG